MASKRISELTSGDGTAQPTDEVVVARSGQNYKFTLEEIAPTPPDISGVGDKLAMFTFLK